MDQRVTYWVRDLCLNMLLSGKWNEGNGEGKWESATCSWSIECGLRKLLVCLGLYTLTNSVTGVADTCVLRTYARLCVCACVLCAYVRTYARLCVYACVRMCVRTYVRMYLCMCVRTYVRIDVRTYVLTYACLCVCATVCACVRMCILVWCGDEGYVSGLQDLKTTARNTTGSNHCIILLSSWWWA